MFDDTRDLAHGGQSPIGHNAQLCLSKRVGAILSHSTNRDHAVRWASNLRVLTFDDSTTERSNSVAPTTSQLGSEDRKILRGQCQPCEWRVAIPSGHLCEQHTFHTCRTKSREAELLEYADPCVHVREHACEHCQHIPLFPNNGTVTRFRIRRVDTSDLGSDLGCDHYVAVSYCWSGGKDNGRVHSYQVVEEDGQVRDTRASDATIDRAVNFAHENGFRMIWIDQECIEQNNPQEKELAIQSMDYVYERAHTSIGLFQTQLQQKHLDCLLLAYEAKLGYQFRSRRGRKAFNGCRAVDLSVLYEAVFMVASDRWNTRAWILQEAFASSGNMLILFPRIRGISVQGWLLVCHELSRSELAVRLDVLQECLRICTSMLGPMLTKTLASKESRSTKLSIRGRGAIRRMEITQSADEMRLTVKRLQLFHPDPPEDQWMMKVNNGKHRRFCNAAVALTYLQLRNLERVADKLAIVANLCGYGIRLDSRELERTQESLATCVLILAIRNGDFSLLVPQFYQTPANILEFPSRENPEFSWAHSFLRDLNHVWATDWNPHGPTAGTIGSEVIGLSEEGLSLTGVLWKVDKFIDLGRFRVIYADSWQRLRHGKGISRPSSRTVKLATTHLLFEIIQCLVSIGEKRVANSILNSTSSWLWRRRAWHPDGDIVESVDQFPPNLKVENRKAMFQLDPDSEECYHQCWIIDRVMQAGGLWSWSVAESFYGTGRDPVSDKEHIFETDNNLDNTPSRGENNSNDAVVTSDIDNGSNQTRELQKIVEAHGSVPNRRRPGPSHLRTMRAGAILALMMEQLALKKDNNWQIKGLFTPGSVSSFAMVIQSLDEESATQYHQRRAVFDVDVEPHKENFVLTPHQTTLESVPRPSVRSMSISWVVEMRDDSKDREENGANVKERTLFGPRKVRAKNMIKGMWEYIIVPSGRYQMV